MSSTPLEKSQELLKSLENPYTNAPFEQWARVLGAKIDDKQLSLTIAIGYPAQQEATQNLDKRIQECLRAYAGKRTISVKFQVRITAAQVQGKLKPMAEAHNIIAVASAKGGVGKSTVSVNLALALSALGARVGLLDGDIYGPSQQMMLGIPADQRPKTKPPKYLFPIEAHNLQSMSIGYLLSEKTPLVWRGPMVSGALQQMVEQTLWKELDYLVVDLPPGTGDIQLTLAQKVPLAGAVVVSTPQELALMDARKGVAMFQKVKIPVLGIVENMAYYLCGACGKQEALFGSKGGGGKLARECDVPLLGSIPLDPTIGRRTDSGSPIVVAEPKSESTKTFQSIAEHVSAIVASLPRAGDDTSLNLRDVTDAMA